jgi:hypothetical protein
MGAAPVTGSDRRPVRTVDFAGRRWSVKHFVEPVGPGPNRFDDSTDAVRIDDDGTLSLRIRRADEGWWTCAEVIADDPCGHGTYEWTVATDLRRLDRQAVCGMFTWSTDTAHANRELDIEVSAWGRGDAVVGRFVVQPADCDGHVREFTVPAATTWTCSLRWAPAAVTFRAADGAPWRFTADGVPPPGGAQPRINLWLHGGCAPHGDGALEVRFADFRFTPG